MKNKYEIIYDDILKTFVLWEIHRNYMIEKHRGYKWECIKKKAKLNGK